MNSILKTLRGTVAAVAIAALVQSVGSMALGPLADASSSQVTATTAVNIRSSASTSSARVGILYKGQKAQSISSSNGWTAVTHGGRTAYIATAYLTSSSVVIEKPSTSTKGTVYTIGNVNLRKGPSLSNSVSRVATKGTKLSTTGTISGSYSQVIHNGTTLWAATSYLSASAGAPSQSLPAVTGRVKATAALMVRTTADRNFSSLGDVPLGTILDATGVVTSGMAQVIWQGNVRWVNNSYVSKVAGSTTSPSAPATPTTTTRYATANLNIWNASTGSAHIGEISRGSAVAVTGKVSGGRAQIVHSGAIRWVTASYLSITAPSASGGSNSGTLNKGYSSGLDQVNENTKKVIRHVWATQPAIKTMYGWRNSATPDHPAGRAVDVMIPNYKSNNALGWRIANYYRANAAQFGITYIIFDQKIWSVARNSQGWRSMANRGNDAANHIDHVHINT
ncbi:MAG: SH3 domain-containing protein [Arachnia sp.]